MQLIRDLMNTSTEIVEQSTYISSSDVKSFKRSHNAIETCMDQLDMYFSPSSQYAKKVASIGGDMGLFNQAERILNQLHQVVDDLHMSTGIAAGEYWND